MGISILHILVSLLTILMLMYTLWTNWVSQIVHLSADSEVKWDWKGNLRDVTKSNVDLDSYEYRNIDQIGELEIQDELSTLLDELYLGGAIAMTIIIVSIIFSTAWLMYGMYTEIRSCCGNRDGRYPY